MKDSDHLSGVSGSDLEFFCNSAQARARWPFLRDLQFESADRARALTHARTDLAGWVHVPEQVRTFALLVQQLLSPGEKLTALSKLNFRSPLTTQAWLLAERKILRPESVPPEVSSMAEFETNYGESISILATPDPSRPFPAEYSGSGSYVAGPSVRSFRWDSPSQTLPAIPEPLLPFLHTQADLVDAAYVLIANAAFRAAFARLPHLLFVLSVRSFELPDPEILVEGGSIYSTINPDASRCTKKGFTTHEVHSRFFDQNGHKDGGAVFTFAVTHDEALVRSFSGPRAR